MTEMNQHFKLTKQEFYESSSLFNTLEIIEEQVVDQNYQYLSEYLEKQYQNLAIENYSQNDPERSRCDEIYKSYQNLKKYIEPLKSGNPCVPVSIDDESNGHLSEREFHYRNKLFAQFNITKEEVVQKTFSDILNVLSSKKYEKKPDHLNMTQLENRVNFYTESAYYHRQLWNYIAPLRNKRNLILADKEALSMKLIKHKNNLTSKMGIPSLYNEHFLISAFFVCSLVISSIANGIILGSLLALALTTAIVAPSFFISSSIGYGIYRDSFEEDSRDRVQKKTDLLKWYDPRWLLMPTIFLKGCEIYIEKHIRDLREEDSRDRVQKETDLLKWYDPRLLLMPIVMPIVRKYFMELSNELAERNFDEVNTNMSNVRSKQQEMTTDIPA